MKTLIFTLLGLIPFLSYGQAEELKQRTALFLEEQSETFKVKELNGNEPDYGVLPETQFFHHSYFQLKQLEREVNELGNSVKPKYHLSTYAYEDEEELKYALKFWFKEFVGGKRITPGRDYRTVDHISPGIIIIEKNYIVILTLSCYSTDIEEFRDWRSNMLGVFGSPNAMVVELGCNGPIEWTKNAPDPKDPSWRR
jgi:hypothetical protein